MAHEIAIDIGGMPVRVRTGSAAFGRLLEQRYAGFIGAADQRPAFELDVDLVAPGAVADNQELRLRFDAGCWTIERGDLRAEWDPVSATGRVRQSENPFAIDSLLRILHTLILARQGGFLVHAASAVRGDRAFLFAGVSGAGKTTIARLAPADVVLLTDEISYVRRDAEGYQAFGTPFAGELARVGENTHARIAALYLLEQGAENRVDRMGTADAARGLLANILFFAKDPELVGLVFESACEFVGRVPAHRLTFVPDPRVWEAIT